ncbi:MAG: membrane protein insertase YidC [Phycisphaerales bacterium]|nr:membrane protein insertase YidC [Phycisphaerales bacterium]
MLRDWSLAIIVLVIVVRGLLHPITRRSQINMAKMQKQMASLAPEIEKLKVKYKGDATKLQSEQMRLYREKGVNPLGMLGCLPMFLQMPIWIALYAMLYYAIELRHEQAFYGIFQGISGGKWGFLADLSRADHFISFPASWHFTVPLLGIPMDGLHILPLLMAVVFFLQFKFTTPPAANEQAAQQQKIMKWMTLLFPVFLYAAPSGLNLYILASTGAGILDSYIVKKHIKKEEEAGTLVTSVPPKPGGLMEKLHKMIEDRQRLNGGSGEGLPPRKK